VTTQEYLLKDGTSHLQSVDEPEDSLEMGKGIGIFWGEGGRVFMIIVFVIQSAT
jgi:hypothetical protein